MDGEGATMEAPIEAPAGAVRKHWVVAGAALLWNLFGCLDFWLTMTRNARWISGLSPAGVDRLDDAPLWAVAGWALAVGCGGLGGLLLMVRPVRAWLAFLAAILGLGLVQAYALVGPPPVVIGGIALDVAVWGVALAFFAYALLLGPLGARPRPGQPFAR